MDKLARLFSAKRYRDELSETPSVLKSLSTSGGGDFAFEEDLLRTTLAAPVRRLQQKTQVFPLDIKASVRSRLTHSLEAQTYARLMVYSIVRHNERLFTPYLKQMLVCASNASLLHDIGNPPFGHFGESLIRSWLRKVSGSELKVWEREDLCAFNGNAQGLRLIHTIQKLNLTYTQIGSVIKVPFTVGELMRGRGSFYATGSDTANFISWSNAHAGVFVSEMPLLNELREQWATDHRHFLACITERADDLSYILADLEDACERSLIDRYTVLHLCGKIADSSDYGELSNLLKPTLIEELWEQSPYDALSYFRNCVAQSFIQDLSLAVASNPEYFIECGEPDFSAGSYPGIMLLEMLRHFEQSQIYTHPEVESLELSGGCYLKGLLSQYEPLLHEEAGLFANELNAKGGDPLLRRLASRISRRHRQAYFEACKEGRTCEMYNRIRLIIDYVSGMTDTYAESEFRIISGLN